MSEYDRNPSMDKRDDGAFLHELFQHADPLVANFMARHNALLERVTVLERALEEIADPMYYPPSMRDTNGAKGIRMLAKRALNA